MDFLTPLRLEEQLHCRRVSAISTFLAEAAGRSSPEVKVIAQSALFHDIGKAALPQECLYKSEPRNQRDQALFMSHTTIGEKMLEGTESILSTAAIVARQHHERLDGSGYLGLPDKSIHPHAKIVAVADVLDSLTYRKGTWDTGQVRDELKRSSGTLLDAELTALLLRNWARIQEICGQVNTHNHINTHF